MVTDVASAGQAPAFADRLRTRARAARSWLCVGLDPDPAQLPSGLPRSAEGLATFCREIIDATAGSAACFKINVAFFEPFGWRGWRQLETVRDQIPSDIPVILDAKRGDVGNTAAAYARAMFDTLHGDAMTASPYLGWDALEPFLAWEGRAVFVLCRTSNPGSRDPQELRVDGEPLYLRVARQAIGRQAAAEIGLVVGATQPAALRAVRALDQSTVILAPGVGAQGGTVQGAMRHGSSDGGDNLLAAVSRDILYASPGADFATAAHRTAATIAAETWGVREGHGAGG